jgi:hypothetical protein
LSTIFISHSSDDKEIASRIRAWLDEKGHSSVFLDFDPDRGIPAGRDWEKELYAQLRACRACIVLCSEASMRSKWCFAEVTQARALGKAIFPVKVGPCEVDPLLKMPQLIDLTVGPEEGFARLGRGLEAAGLDPVHTFDWDPARPPYPGLFAFDESDAAVFCGGDDQIRDGLDALQQMARFTGTRFVLFLGASGSGKSSLLRAGLVSRLRRDPKRWIVTGPFRPQDNPLDSLSSSLAAAFKKCDKPRDWKKIRDQLIGPHSATTLLELVRELRLDMHAPEAMVLLAVDQLEEVFGLTNAEDTRQFLSILRGAVETPGSPVVIAATLRSDFLDKLQTHSAVTGFGIADVLVSPIPVSKLGEIVEAPARLAGLELEPGLAQALVHDTQAADALPLLAFALRALWEKRSDGRLTFAVYKEIGGVTGSVARAAEQLLKGVTAGDETELRHAFLSMVRIDEQGHFVKQPAPFNSVPAQVKPLLESFVQERLLVSHAEGDSRMLEPSHDALLYKWTRLAKWIEEDQAFLLWRRRVREGLDDWLRANKTRDRLLKGVLLREGEARLKADAERVSQNEVEFLRASITADRWARRLRSGVVGAVTVALIVSGVYSTYKGNQARKAAERARAQGLVSMAASLASTDPLTAYFVLSELRNSEPPAGALAVAHRVASESLPASVLVGGLELTRFRRAVTASWVKPPSGVSFHS